MRKEIKSICVFCVVAVVGSLACKKIVEVRPTTSDEVVACSSQSNIAGRWITDSVHIITKIDTIDTLLIDRQPTLTYFMATDCANDTLFRLHYVTFAGVKTEKVRSTNFSVLENGVFVFDPFSTDYDTTEASFSLRFERDSAGQNLRAWFVEQPNPYQITTTNLFFRKENGE